MENRPILIYDGTCSFCSASVDFILRHEKNEEIRFLWLQSPLADKYIAEHRIPEGTDSIIFIANDDAHIKSNAALKIAAYLQWPYNWTVGFTIIPRSIRDFFYDLIARYRKKIMGSTSCALPIGKEDRFITTD